MVVFLVPVTYTTTGFFPQWSGGWLDHSYHHYIPVKFNTIAALSLLLLYTA